MVADEIVLDRFRGGEATRNALQLVAGIRAESAAGTPREAKRLIEGHDRQDAWARTPGLVLVLARVGSEVVGFAYGRPHEDQDQGQGQGQDKDKDKDKDKVFQLAVRNRWQHKGIEQLLRDALLEGR